MENREKLNQMVALMGTSPIKVITGVRRCGKSTLLDLFEEHLLESGVRTNHIIRMNFELSEFNSIRDYRELGKYIESRIRARGTTYILLDEVQLVPGWERAINAINANRKKTDIYLTGSNAYMLSSELASLLSGRYIEIKMLPLSFKEYLVFQHYKKNKKGKNIREHFFAYMQYGGFPGLIEFNETHAALYLESIYNTILVKDVMSRSDVRDVDLLGKVARYIVSNIGNFVTAKKISGFLTSSGRKTNHETVDNYLRILENAFLIYRVPRYNLKGKEQLKTNCKFYIVDLGLRFWVLGRKNTDIGSMLENIVYLELRRRGYEVFVGTLGACEIDFVAMKEGITKYYQVTATMLNKDVATRELKPLQSIKDNYEKIILTLDDTIFNDYDGIESKNIIEFLLE